MVWEIRGKMRVFGSRKHTNPSTFHFPSWHEDAVTWLIRKRQINAIGVDSASLDYGQSKTLPCHTFIGEEQHSGHWKRRQLRQHPRKRKYGFEHWGRKWESCARFRDVWRRAKENEYYRHVDVLHILAESPGQCFHVLVSYLDTFSNVDTFWDNTQIYGGL